MKSGRKHVIKVMQELKRKKNVLLVIFRIHRNDHIASTAVHIVSHQLWGDTRPMLLSDLPHQGIPYNSVNPVI